MSEINKDLIKLDKRERNILLKLYRKLSIYKNVYDVNINLMIFNDPEWYNKTNASCSIEKDALVEILDALFQEEGKTGLYKHRDFFDKYCNWSRDITILINKTLNSYIKE